MRLSFRRVLAFVLLLLAGVASHGATPPEVILRLKHGDDPRWAVRDWDDRDWAPLDELEFPVHAGVYWVRIHLTRPAVPTPRPADVSFYNYFWPPDEPGAPIDAVVFNPVYSFELYWDGQLLGRGGVVGNDLASEKPGPQDHLYRIPENLRGPGEHVVAVRLSTYHFNCPGPSYLAFRLENYERQLVSETRKPALPLLGAFCSLVLAGVCLALTRFARRRRPLFGCVALGVALALYYGLVALRWLYNPPYHWNTPRMMVIGYVIMVIAALLPWVLAEHFELPRRGRWLLALLAVLAVCRLALEMPATQAFWLSRTMLLAAAAIAIWAWRGHRAGAPWLLAGALAGLLFVGNDGRAPLDGTFFVLVGGLMAFVIVAVTGQIRTERQRAQEAALSAARLETELLKKNIQPHFLLNTLTAVSEVIEQDPAGAVKFIDDLAAEFRSLALMSGERLVPLQRELDLCRAHLKVISRRTGRKISLEADGVEPGTPVPPALFLTLIENGFVHQQVEDRATFVLSTRPTAEGVAFAFQSPGRIRPQSDQRVGGTGLRYVRARLEESFPGRWTLSQGPAEAGWETVIEWSTVAAGRPA